MKLFTVLNAVKYIKGVIESERGSPSIDEIYGYLNNITAKTLNKHFKDTIGITPGRYIRDIQLCYIINTLRKYPELSIEQVSGIFWKDYKSFSEIINKLTGRSPSAFIKSKLDFKNYTDTFTKIDEYKNKVLSISHEKVQIIDEINLIGFTHEQTVSIENKKYESIWNTLEKNISKIKNIRIPVEKYGINKIDLSIEEFCRKSDIGAFAGVRVNRINDDLPKNAITNTIHNGQYLKFTHKGVIKKIDDTYNKIFEFLQLSTTYQYDNERTEFELYNEHFITDDHEESQTFIHIPVIENNLEDPLSSDISLWGKK